jgi:hypothetical protein
LATILIINIIEGKPMIVHKSWILLHIDKLKLLVDSHANVFFQDKLSCNSV